MSTFPYLVFQLLVALILLSKASNLSNLPSFDNINGQFTLKSRNTSLKLWHDLSKYHHDMKIESNNILFLKFPNYLKSKINEQGYTIFILSKNINWLNTKRISQISNVQNPSQTAIL